MSRAYAVATWRAADRDDGLLTDPAPGWRGRSGDGAPELAGVHTRTRLNAALNAKASE